MNCCQIDECRRNAVGWGMCNKHYARWSRHGDPMFTERRYENGALIGDRLTYNVTTIGCWEYSGSIGRSGYGRVSAEGVYTQAHRVAYEEWVGPIPEGLFICHHCDNPPCINPAHLYAGTQQDNVDDMVRRSRNIKGTTVNSNKLSEQQVLKIHEDTRPLRTIATEYGMGISQVSRIRTGKAWAWLTHPRHGSGRQ